jgi:hypothetical protein
MAKDPDINSRMNGIGEVIEQLEADSIPLDEESELYEGAGVVN